MQRTLYAALLALGMLPGCSCSDEAIDPAKSVEPDAGGDAGAGGGAGAPPTCETELPSAAELRDGTWSASFLLPGVNGDAPGLFTTARGSAGEVYAGGLFSFAGTVSARNVALWSESGGWSALGEGVPGAVTASAVAPDGSLWVATSEWNDDFTSYWHTIRRWNATWEEVAVVTLPPDLSEPQRSGIQRMVFDDAGNLVVAGDFSAIDGVAVSRLATLGPTGWDGLLANPDAPVFALLAGAGELCVGGAFGQIGGISASRVACRSGTTWTAFDLDDPTGTAFVRTLARDPAGVLYAGGLFSLSDPGTNDGGSIASWNGSEWQLVDRGVGIWDSLSQTNMPGLVRDLAWVDGELVVGGSFYNAGGTDAAGVANVDVLHLAWIQPGTSSWQDAGKAPLGVGVAFTGDNVFSLSTDGSDLVAAGIFSSIADASGFNVARRVGGSWAPLGKPGELALGVEGSVAAMVSGSCEIYVAGTFTRAGGTAASNIASFRIDSGFAALGAGLEGPVTALIVHPETDELYAAETVCVQLPEFLDCAQTRVMHWDGSAWEEFAATSPGALFALTFTADGTLFGAGSVADENGVGNVVRWTGSAWEPVGGGVVGAALALLLETDGSVIVGGAFETAGSVAARNVARWDGSAWSPLGAGLEHPVLALVRADDQLIAGTQKSFGSDPASPLVAAWDGSKWSNIGTELEKDAPNPQIQDIVVLGDSLVVVGQFPILGGAALLEGGSWTLLGGMNQLGQAALVRPEGLYVAGGFSLVADQPSVGLGLLQTAGAN
jgi:hypothetical protein